MLSTMDVSEKELWIRWTGRREHVARETLIQMHMSWTRMVAKDVYLKARIRGADWADYVQNATVGLIEAIDRYELDRGVDFRTYARHRVRGSVFNGLRHLTSTSQDYRSRTTLEERSASLANGEHDPLETFVSWTVGLGIGHLLEAASLESALDDPDNGPYATVARGQMTEALKRALDKLPRRERMVLMLHYFQHIPFVDIANQLRVTKGRISQIHHQAIRTMRAHMQESFCAEV